MSKCHTKLGLKKLENLFFGSTLKKWITVLFIFALFAYGIVPFFIGYWKTGYAHGIEVLILIGVYTVVMFAISKIEDYSDKTLKDKGKKEETESNISLDTTLKILSIAGAVLLGAYGFFTGVNGSEIDIKLECIKYNVPQTNNGLLPAKDINTKDAIAVTAFVEKGKGSSIQFFEAYAMLQKSEDVTKNKKPEGNIPLATIKRSPDLDGIFDDSDKNKMHLNQGDSLTLSTVIDGVEHQTNYIITVYLIGKTMFSIPKEQWTSSCIVMGNDWKKVKNEDIEPKKQVGK